MPRKTKTAPPAKLLYQLSFSILQLSEPQHKQHGLEKGQMQQSQQVFQDPSLYIK